MSTRNRLNVPQATKHVRNSASNGTNKRDSASNETRDGFRKQTD